MAAELTNYVLQERPIQPMIDLGIMQNTLATITAGNKEALQKQSELRTAIANLDLNEAEDGYKQQLYDDITKTIDDNAIEGNAYFALDDIIKKQGDIASNEGLIGRLKAQQAYKQYQAQLDERAARGDISFDTAAWAKEKNPYHYEDNYKLDEQGNQVLDENGSPIIIGGTRWTPEFQPVRDIDFNEILKLAAQYVSPDAGQNTSVSFLGADGKPTSEPTGSFGILNNTTNKWERLTPEKLRAGIDAAMAANPQYEASLKQAYKVLEWKLEKGEKNSPLLDPKTGGKKDFDAYLSDMIDPFIRAKQYSHTFVTKQYHDAAFTAMNRAAQGGTKKLYNPTTSDIPGSMGHSIEWKDTSRSQALVAVNSATAQVKDLISSLGINNGFNYNSVDIRNTDQLAANLKSAGASEEQISSVVKFANKQVHDNADAYRYYDALLSQKNKSGAATIMSDYILAGIDISDDMLKDNPHLQKYYKEYNDMINAYFGNKKYFGFSVDDKEYERLLGYLGVDENSVKSLGYTIIKKGNKNIIGFDREHGSLFGQFVEAANKAHSESSWWNRNFSKNDYFTTFDENGENIEPTVTVRGGVSSGSPGYVDKYAPIEQYNAFKRQIDKNKDLATNPESRLIGGMNIPGLNPREYTAYEGMYTAETAEELSYYTNLQKAVDKTLNAVLNPAAIMNTRVYSVQDGSLISMDSAKKVLLSQFLNGKADKLEHTMFYNPALGTVIPQFTYSAYSGKEVNPITGDKTPLVFTSEGLLNDEDLKELNKSAQYAASSVLYRNNLNNINTDIGYFVDNDGKYIHYCLSPVIGEYGGDKYRNLVLNDGTIVARNLGEKEATDMLVTFNGLHDLCELIASPTVTDEERAYMLNILNTYNTNKNILTIGLPIVEQMINTYTK